MDEQSNDTITLPDGVTVDADRYGTEYTTMDVSEGYPEIAFDYTQNDEGEDELSLITQRFRTYGDSARRAVRYTRRSFVAAFQSMLETYQRLAREGKFVGYEATAGYRLSPGYGGTPDLISAAYVNRSERALMLGGLRFTMPAAMFETLKTKVNAVSEPIQRIEQGGTFEVRVDYTASHTFEIEVDDVLDGDAESWEDPDTGIFYWLVEGTEDEVRDLFYETDEINENDLPSSTWEWDYFERENTEFESFPEIEEHEVPEEEDEDE